MAGQRIRSSHARALTPRLVTGLHLVDNVDDPLGVLDTGRSRWADGTG